MDSFRLHVSHFFKNTNNRQRQGSTFKFLLSVFNTDLELCNESDICDKFQSSKFKSGGTCLYAQADRGNRVKLVTMQEELGRKIYMFQFQSPVGCNSHNLLDSFLGSLAVCSVLTLLQHNYCPEKGVEIL